MTRTEAIKKINEKLSKTNFRLTYVKSHNGWWLSVVISHFDTPSAYFKISFELDHLNIFSGCELNCISEFVKLYTLIDGE